jgi:hypothetical protein
VQVDLVRGLLPTEDGTAGRMLLGYHVAGAVKFDLDHPKLAKDNLADKPAAIEATMIAYKTIQKAKPGYKVALLDRLAELKRNGRLKAHIKTVMSQQAG